MFNSRKAPSLKAAIELYMDVETDTLRVYSPEKHQLVSNRDIELLENELK